MDDLKILENLIGSKAYDLRLLGNGSYGTAFLDVETNLVYKVTTDFSEYILCKRILKVKQKKRPKSFCEVISARAVRYKVNPTWYNSYKRTIQKFIIITKNAGTCLEDIIPFNGDQHSTLTKAILDLIHYVNREHYYAVRGTIKSKVNLERLEGYGKNLAELEAVEFFKQVLQDYETFKLPRIDFHLGNICIDSEGVLKLVDLGHNSLKTSGKVKKGVLVCR